MGGIIDTVKYQWRTGSILLRLIFVNVVVYLAISLLLITCALLNLSAGLVALSWLQLPSSIPSLLYKPWTLLTYMFVHTDFWHLLFNMLWLYWFGSILVSVDTSRRLLGLYLLGGLAGALFFVVAFAVFPGLSGDSAVLTGASASVIAVVAATSMRYPDYRVQLMFFGDVALKWVGLITLGFCLLQNSLAVFPAHFGGLLVGVVYAAMIGHGIDMTRWLNRLIDRVVNSFRGRKRCTVVDDGVPYDRIDEIITKVKKSGYASLTDDEKRYLFRSK